MSLKVEQSNQYQEAEVSEVDKALFLVGNNPAKLIAGLALTAFEPGEYVGQKALHNQIEAMQGVNTSWTPNRTTLGHYCKSALVPSGVAEFHPYTTKKLVRLTPRGWTLLPVLAGGLCELQLESLDAQESGIERALSLQDVIGVTSLQKDGRISSGPARFAIYRRLLRQAPNEGLRQTELFKELKGQLLHSSFLTLITHLYQQGIIRKERSPNHLQDNEPSQEIILPTEYRYYLRKLLNIQKYLNESSKPAVQFHKSAKAKAEKLMDSSEEVSQLLWHTKHRSGRLDPHGWKRDVCELIPVKGIDALDLYREILRKTGRHVVYSTFKSQLSSISGIEIIDRSVEGTDSVSPQVKLKKQRFSKMWTLRAACRGEDPELFYPYVGTGPVMQEARDQAELAKKICSSCPVRQPCLRKAVDSKEKHGVRGGVWFANPSKELSDKAKEQILHTIEVR